MYIFGIIILVFFAVIGIGCFIGSLIKAGFVSDSEGFILLIPSVNEDNAEARLRSATAIASSARDCRIICVCSASNPAEKICKKFPQAEIIENFAQIQQQLLPH